MDFKLLSYNVLFNKAFPKLEKIFLKYDPDILCLQEVDTNEDNLLSLEKYGYQLADYSNSALKFGSIYGIATYFKPNKIVLKSSDSYDLPKSFYELLITAFRLFRGGNKARTILKTDLQFKTTNKKVSIYNIHLTLLGINRERKKQLQSVLKQEIYSNKAPVILTGDFNYFPYRRKTLEELMTKHGFEEATKNLMYTMRIPPKSFARYGFLQEIGAKFARKFYKNRLKPDYTFYKNITLIKTERIRKEFSDHYPIIFTFELK